MDEPRGRSVASVTPPAHVAIIMDGNGRWAKARHLPRTLGHKAGAEAVRRTVRAAVELGLTHLTLFGFSTENWRRPRDEVNDLMNLLRFYLSREVAELHAEKIRLRVIGQRHRLPRQIVDLITHAEELTAENERFTLTIALSYGARDELAAAARELAALAMAGEIDPAAIDESAMQSRLYTAGLPDPDLVIRTSGEMRMSNFLLWQCAYSELVFLDRLWPDFGKADLEQAISLYLGRERRFGATTAESSR